MQYRLNQSLGLFDARKCNTTFGANLPLDGTKLKEGCVVDLPEPAALWFFKRYPALLCPIDDTIVGRPKRPEITAPAKPPKQSEINPSDK